MFQRRTCAGLLAVLLLSGPATAVAQNFRVYTIVYDEHGGQSRPVARSLSLFHAGKTYDFIQEVQEVIIFEPSQRGFTLLNTRQMTSTKVLFEELNGQLKVARETFREHLANFSMKDEPVAIRLQKQLQFQIDPRFDEVRENDHVLTLRSDFMKYRVRLARLESSENVDAYLQYADQICKLNYVLYPGPLLPEPRLALNKALRKAKAIPTEVELIADVETRIHRRAEHRIDWNLDEKDRALINDWEKLLASKDVKKITFSQYQRALLVSQNSRRK